MKVPASGQWLRAIEDSNVIQPEKPAGEHVLAEDVFAVHPPCEVQEQLLKCSSQKAAVSFACFFAGSLVHMPAGPCMDGRIHIAEIPFVGGDLTIRMHVPFTQKQNHLILGEFGVDMAKRDHVKGGIPCSVPRVFPFIGHRNDVAVVQVRPVAVSHLFAVRWLRRHVGVALQPVVNTVVVELLGPHQAAVRLSHRLLRIFRQCGWNFCVVEAIRFV